MGLPLSRAMPARAFLVWLVLAAPAAHAESWSARDVEAAEQYRTLERERAERYRAALERAPETPRERGAAGARSGPMAARLSEWLGAKLGAWLGELLAGLEGWLVRQLEPLREWLGESLDEPPPRRELFQVEREREPFGDWLAREEERARRLLEGLEARAAPRVDPQEWAERESARAREWARREARRERAPRAAPWEERWREAEASWERIERERALRHLEQGREWRSQERERLEGR